MLYIAGDIERLMPRLTRDDKVDNSFIYTIKQEK